MSDWFSELLKFGAGVISALVTVWVAGIVKKGTLAETLREEQAEIREWLKTELEEVRAEHAAATKTLTRINRVLRDVRSLLQIAVDRRAQNLPYDEHMAAALARLNQEDID